MKTSRRPRTTAEELASRRRNMIPADLLAERQDVTVVSGPPGISYADSIRKHMEPGDLLIDYDALPEDGDGDPSSLETMTRRELLDAVQSDTLSFRQLYIVTTWHAGAVREATGGRLVTSGISQGETEVLILNDASKDSQTKRHDIAAAAVWYIEQRKKAGLSS